MKFDLHSFKENEDGSATMLLDADEEAKEYLINLGVIAVIEKAIKEYKLEDSTAGHRDES